MCCWRRSQTAVPSTSRRALLPRRCKQTLPWTSQAPMRLISRLSPGVVSGRAHAAGLLCSQQPPPCVDEQACYCRRRTSWQTGSAGTAAWCPTPPRGVPGTPTTAPLQRRRTRCAYAHQRPPALVTMPAFMQTKHGEECGPPLRMVLSALRTGRPRTGLPRRGCAGTFKG